METPLEKHPTWQVVNTPVYKLVSIRNFQVQKVGQHPPKHPVGKKWKEQTSCLVVPGVTTTL